MSILTAIVILVPSILGFVTSMTYAYLGYKRLKERDKDEIWETVTRIICANGQEIGGDEFADLYEELKAFKKSDCSLPKGATLAQFARQKRIEQEVSNR